MYTNLARRSLLKQDPSIQTRQAGQRSPCRTLGDPSRRPCQLPAPTVQLSSRGSPREGSPENTPARRQMSRANLCKGSAPTPDVPRQQAQVLAPQGLCPPVGASAPHKDVAVEMLPGGLGCQAHKAEPGQQRPPLWMVYLGRYRAGAGQAAWQWPWSGKWTGAHRSHAHRWAFLWGTQPALYLGCFEACFC